MKLITSLLAAAAISVASFAAPAFAQDKGTVGISMPTKTSTRWISDGETMEKLFKEAGYTPDLQFADDDIPNQLAQIENMVTKGAKVLVIGAIDGTTLSDVLQKAHDAGRQGHRLRPSDPQLGQCRLLRHLRQLPGRRAAGNLAGRRA